MCRCRAVKGEERDKHKVDGEGEGAAKVHAEGWPGDVDDEKDVEEGGV